MKHDSNQITRDYFDSLLVETRFIDSELPDTTLELWGETFDTPVMTAALSHLHNICENGMVEFALGAKNAPQSGISDSFTYSALASSSELKTLSARIIPLRAATR